MTNSLIKRISSPRWAFVSLALLVNVAASMIAQAVKYPVRHRYVEMGAAFDVTVTVTALYYWLVVRRGLRAHSSLIGVAILGLLRAAFAFPSVIPGKELLAAGAECAVLVVLFIGFRRQPGDDPVERLRGALAGILPFETAERALAGEFSVLWYAFAWRARPHIPADAQPFTLHRRSAYGDMVLCLGLAALLDILPLHFVVRRWSGTAAWVLTALSLYGAVWITGLFRSLELRPTLAHSREATIRLGLFFTLRVPAESIARIGMEVPKGALILPRGSTATVCIEFKEPLTAGRLFGLRRRVSSVALAADDPAGLTAALRQMA